MLIRKISSIGRTYRQVERYSEILGVFFKFGFGDLVNTLKVDQYLNIGRQMFLRERKEKIEAHSRAARVRMVLEELGPTFIKLGQMLSTRSDLLPPEFIMELSKLRDDVPPYPFEEAKTILTTELADIPADTFDNIDPEPLAAASIGQVHKARLARGDEVVLKIQRPGIRRIVEVDLEILLHLATLGEKHVEGWDLHKPTEVVEEFGRTLERELDYRIEASNMDRFTELHRDDEQVYIPKVYHDLTTPRVLTMEYVRGVSAGSMEELKEKGYNLPEIADRGADIVMEQTLVHGFFHADPHPGNLLILPGHVICLLDMGMTGRIDRATRENIVDLIMAVARRDAGHIVGALLKMTEWEVEPGRRAIERDVADFVDQHFFGPLKDMELGALLQQVFEIALNYRMRVPPDLLLLIKALTAVEGLGRQLNPDFDIVEKATPFVKRVQIERFEPKRLAGDFLDYSLDFFEMMKEVPYDLNALLRMVKKGQLKFDIEHKGLEEMRITQDRSSNRLAFAIVLASLIIGSSLIIQSGIPPTWHDIPIIGLIGFLVAGVMGFWLLITILRRGMM